MKSPGEDMCFSPTKRLLLYRYIETGRQKNCVTAALLGLDSQEFVFMLSGRCELIAFKTTQSFVKTELS